MPFYESPAQSPALSEVAEDDLYDLDLQRLNQELQGEDELDADGESTGAQAHMNEVRRPSSDAVPSRNSAHRLVATRSCRTSG